ncbi:iron-sulfur cluster assembly scaffold protein NifU [Lebetimonas sp. JS032]|uniref:iron-sulfur cluster assembly scaffold protein NifU n=1 Tax=Lebetimonas sp. JS032 TaxID=990070 RepID=UPI000463FB80|nr:iron-sulfur cluster assembly scaffold protein NifU [Lebetimonas sp. JS032]
MGRNDLITGNVWEQYSNKVIERMNNPKFLGEFSEEDAKKRGAKLVVADFGSEACGDSVRLYWLVDPNTDKIIDARFKSFGCGTAIASSDMMTELTIGKTVDEAMKITNLDVEKALRDEPDKPAFPPQKMHCSVMAYDVIIEAAAKYKGEDAKKLKNSEIVCECARVTRGEIEEIVRKHNVKSVEELQKYTDAGTYCKSCVAPGGHEERDVYLVDIIKEVQEEMKKEKLQKGAESQKFEDMSLVKKIKAVEEILDKKIKPALAMDGGSLELIDVKENGDKFEVYVRYLGACASCASGMMTLMGIEDELNRSLNTDKIKVIQI